MAEEILPGQERPEPKIPTFPEVGGKEGINLLEILSIAAAGIVIVAAIIFVVLARSADNQLKIKDQELQELEAELLKPDLATVDLRVRGLASAASNLSSAMEKKVYWSKLFADIQINTLKNVKYNNLSVDDKGVVKIDGEANSYSDLAKLLGGLRNSNKLTDITLVSATATTTAAGSKILFSAQGKINPAELK